MSAVRARIERHGGFLRALVLLVAVASVAAAVVIGSLGLPTRYLPAVAGLVLLLAAFAAVGRAGGSLSYGRSF